MKNDKAIITRRPRQLICPTIDKAIALRIQKRVDGWVAETDANKD